MVFRKTSKSLGAHNAKIFEIFRGASIRTDILPKYSVGCPCIAYNNGVKNNKDTFLSARTIKYSKALLYSKNSRLGKSI